MARRCAAGLLAAAAPFLGMLATFAWKKPWGVVVGEQTRNRTNHLTGDRAEAEAEQIAGQIRADATKRGISTTTRVSTEFNIEFAYLPR